MKDTYFVMRAVVRYFHRWHTGVGVVLRSVMWHL